MGAEVFCLPLHVLLEDQNPSLYGTEDSPPDLFNVNPSGTIKDKVISIFPEKPKNSSTN